MAAHLRNCKSNPKNKELLPSLDEENKVIENLDLITQSHITEIKNNVIETNPKEKSIKKTKIVTNNNK